ncbi:Serine/threonine-protein phosphatase 2A activator 2 [Thelotrema lepadinum]|nr:Serine/threonine-protein phosphatase 2A activator 2 [Thelotrema lepadinum]
MPIDSGKQPSLGNLNIAPGSAAKLKLPALTRRKPQPPPENPHPVPNTPALPKPSAVSSLTPVEPSRRILSKRDLDLFLDSSSYSLITSFVFSISESCADKKTTSISTKSTNPIIKTLLEILDSTESLIDDNPPKDQGASRFGNPAFRGFVDALVQHSHNYHRKLNLPSEDWDIEVTAYLEHSFGSRSRIDYGSGHELNFAMWLWCLNRLSLIEPIDFPALGLLVFPRYIKLLRKIQSTYYLEPAGSHGVWGLDDYHFLPFLFGASQLLHHPYIRPRAVHNDLTLEEEGDDYMYLDMVRWTMETKTVKGLKWTQPMLDDISGAKNWIKVEQGMRRMFVKEVLGKLPIMQHFLFGTLIPATREMSYEASLRDRSDEVASSDNAILGAPKHSHEGDTWGDCCGIKIPSTVAVGQEAKKSGVEGLRRIPFD